MLHGFSEALRDPSVSVLIAETADKRALASAFGWYSSLKMSAGSLGRALSGALLWLLLDNYTQVFFVAFALSAAPLFVIVRYLREPEIDPAENHHESATPAAAETNGKAALLPIVILGSLISATAMMISNLFPVLATEYAHLNTAQAGLINLIAPLITIISGPLFGWLADNVSRKPVLMVRGVANICSSLLFIYAPNFAGLAVGNSLDAMGKAAFRPAWGALMAQAASLDRQRRARVMSYFGLGEGIGETIGPLLGGFLWNRWGVATMLGVRVALAVLGEIYALVAAKESGRPTEERAVEIA
jgi:MFS family permease